MLKAIFKIRLSHKLIHQQPLLVGRQTLSTLSHFIAPMKDSNIEFTAFGA